MKNSQNKKDKPQHFAKDDIKRSPSILYGQLGLVLALLLSYMALESKTLINDKYAKEVPVYKGEMDPDIPDTTPKIIPPKPVVRKPILATEIVDIDIIEDTTPTEESVFTTNFIDSLPSQPVIPDLPEVIIPEDDSPETFTNIKEAPVFPGCTGSKEEIKKCFSKSVKTIILKKFDSQLGQELNLSPGKKRIAAQFVVDKNGKIMDIKVRAPHKRLEKETRRVIQLLPQMKAGKKDGKPVGVRFTLPITFEVLE
ncbi:MAG TPA: hypothetical protein ENK75_03040 [Saprospiraceae bacterium]|nr:hypothetical protein [Saprospiraceae bacterium]